MDFNKIKELDSKNYMSTFNRYNICIDKGDGSKLYDTNGKEYIDFVGGIAVNCLGYNHPKLVKAISDQAAKLIHISNLFYTQEQVNLCEKLLSETIFTKMFLSNSGAEANEAAIKLVRKYFYNRNENKYKILTAKNSFHGRTLATLTATGQEKYSKPYAPLPPGFEYVPFNDFEALKNALTPDVAAVMLEPIQGESGVNSCAYDYLVNTYALCKSRGVLLILDEVQTGMGRTGKMFAFEHYGIQPDIITLAKGLGGGLPIGAVLARGDVANAFKAGDHGSTFGGNPLCCAAAYAVTSLLKETDMIEQVALKGDYLMAKLSKLKKYKFVVEIRGKGLLVGLQLSDKIKGAEIVGKMAANGILVNCAGNNTLRFMPPYIITNEEIDEMVNKLGDLFASTNI